MIQLDEAQLQMLETGLQKMIDRIDQIFAKWEISPAITTPQPQHPPAITTDHDNSTNTVDFEETDDDEDCEIETEEEWFAGFQRSRQRLLETLRQQDEDNGLAITPVTARPQPAPLPSSDPSPLQSQTPPATALLHIPFTLTPHTLPVNTSSKDEDDVLTLIKAEVDDSELLGVDSSSPLKMKDIRCTSKLCDSLWGQFRLRYGRKSPALPDFVSRCFERNAKFIDTGWHPATKGGMIAASSSKAAESQNGDVTKPESRYYSVETDLDNGMPHLLYSNISTGGSDFVVSTLIDYRLQLLEVVSPPIPLDWFLLILVLSVRTGLGFILQI